MKKIQFGMLAIIALLVWSCSQNHKEAEVADVLYESEAVKESSSMLKSEAAMDDYEAAPSEDLSPETYISSSAAVENPNDTTRRMIRTANIKFKVKDVIKSTYIIEDIVVRHNGFVENTRLTSEINRTEETPIKEDSTLITSYYATINTLILRVPNTQLDTTLKEIAQLVDFMDYRIINAEDVTLDLLSKKLEQIRLAKYGNRMKNAIDNKGSKLNDISDAEDNLLHKQEQADNATLANLQILDKIKFSTITLSLYQNQKIKYEVVAKEKKIEPYVIPFGERFVDALKFGWTIIMEICLFLINCWSIILVAILVLWGVKCFRKRTSKTKSEEK